MNVCCSHSNVYMVKSHTTHTHTRNIFKKKIDNHPHQICTLSTKKNQSNEMKKNQPSKNYISMAVEDMKQKKNFLWVVHSSIRIIRAPDFFFVFFALISHKPIGSFSSILKWGKKIYLKKNLMNKKKQKGNNNDTNTNTQREKQLIQWQIWWWCCCCWWLMESKLPTINQPINQKEKKNNKNRIYRTSMLVS